MTAETKLSFGIEYCERFPALLHAMRSTILVSSHNLDGLLIISSNDGCEIQLQVVRMPRVLGVAVNASQTKMAFAAYAQLLRYDRVMKPHEHPVLQSLETKHDSFYYPVQTHVTGFLDTHDIAFGGSNDGESIYLVNTRFNCIATIETGKQFKSVWRPPFISKLVAQDHCHLNGMAMKGGKPEFVSYFSDLDSKLSWQSESSFTGGIMRISDEKVIANELSLPHSPKWHNDSLYFCESGTGSVWCWDVRGLKKVIEVNGFTRGLTLTGKLGFVGLSKIRGARDGSKRFSDMPLLSNTDELSSGIVAFDLRSGEEIATLNFSGVLDQIYDVTIIKGERFPKIFEMDENEVSEIIVYS
ncbi:TIGR03032 family protein [Pseudoalteromonas piscicida]|uniref:TIGR03032 family protein n=1 Tax=Pseudoalteromonas piscicida TaxID=43662 RepID=A0AAQ2ETK6_PSEO7|nr:MULTISPECIES: TIGR03032 family protein [Pseudoalteromonas]KJY89645.1 hypothetical protein TW75_09730 [Pseudoalteromonas piscicida]MDP4486390.1 TIGR03032 family protein [Pseudoalteromonas piscicida]TMN37252.1 TIGR03032 family protein [Pseudoalteromonas piscicida]TMN43831.1 TIGR03032 family protein [Pseudoalteromonas piscicida]TMN56745.1 TIGR03032 family protein [Pseudoalteromonas piscicida]